MPTLENAEVDHCLRFGLFELLPQTGELRKAGVRIHLQDQPFRILVLLLSRPGQLVTREDLKTVLSPATTFGDLDHMINVAVGKLRSALSDPAEAPIYIETLPRRGYRFIAPVVRVETPPYPADGLRASNDVSRPIARKPLKTIVAGLIIASLVLAAIYLFQWQKKRHPEAGPAMVAIPVTSLRGEEGYPSVSPDGTRLAFVWRNSLGSKEEDLYVKVLGTEHLLRLTSGAIVRQMEWSADGKNIFFIRDGKLLMVSALGGPELPIVSLGWIDYPSLARLGVTPDGNSVIVTGMEDLSRSRLYRIDLRDRSMTPITTPPENGKGDRGAAVSPNGKLLAFTRSHSWDQWDLFIQPLSGVGPTRLTFMETSIQGFDWTPDGKWIVFSAVQFPGGAQLWRVPTQGGTPEQLAIAGNGVMPNISEHGQLVFKSWTMPITNLWALDLTRHGPPLQRLTATSQLDTAPSLSPNGTEVVFASSRSGSGEIWQANLNETDAQQLTFFGKNIAGSPKLGPDGRSIVFDYRPDNYRTLYVLDIQGGEPRRLLQSSLDDVVPSWSWGGKWIYFSRHEAGHFSTWKVPAAGGVPRQVSPTWGFYPQEAPDGSVYFIASGSEFWRIDPVSGKENKVLELRKGEIANSAAWAIALPGIFYLSKPVNDADRGPSVMLYDFKTKRTRTITELPARSLFGPAPPFSISRDGKRAVVAILEAPEEEDIMLVEDFAPAPK